MNLRDKFELVVHQSNGSEFQALFSRVMGYLHADFSPVASHGNIGDRGNDGWLQSSGTYYQVYAPRELWTNTATAQKKIKEDFAKLKANWARITPIRKFYFVVNDKFLGVSPHITETMSEIQAAESLEFAGVYDTMQLERDLFSLQQDQIYSVLGVSPPAIDYVAEDKRRVRDFLDYFSLAFSELFPLGSEAGYFFPTSVLNRYSGSIDSDWELQRLMSNESSIAQHQAAIRDALIAMFQQLRDDLDYDNIGLSIKYKPSCEPKMRDQLINERKESMGTLVDQMKSSYYSIRHYAV